MRTIRVRFSGSWLPTFDTANIYKGLCMLTHKLICVSAGYAGLYFKRPEIVGCLCQMSSFFASKIEGRRKRRAKTKRVCCRRDAM